MKHPRTAVALAGLALAGTIATVFADLPARKAQATPAPSAELPLLRTVTPKQPAAANELVLPARTAPVEQAQVFARATGVVAERRVELGDRVRAGQVLAVIAAPDVDRSVERARAGIAQAKAREELAATNLERAEALVARGFQSKQVLDERTRTLEAARADREVAEAEKRRLATIQDFQVVRAPFAGIVAERRVDRGDRVSGDQAQGGAHLFRIVRLDSLRVEVDAPQAAALTLAPGAQTEVHFAELPGERFAARVVSKSGVIDPRSGTMRVELTMANPKERIPAGMVGQVVLQLPRAGGGLLVPANALVTRDGVPHLALVDAASTVRFVRVRLGQTQGDQLEILEGLSPTSAVVLSPNALLREGDAVRIAPPAAPRKPG
jgi:RND family efflux transporter MFP subunit